MGERPLRTEASCPSGAKEFLETSGETHIAVGNDAAGNAVETYHFVEEEPGSVGRIRSLGASDEVRHLAKTVDDHENRIMLPPSARKAQDEI